MRKVRKLETENGKEEDRRLGKEEGWAKRRANKRREEAGQRRGRSQW